MGITDRERLLSYCGGLIDGEGCIGAYRSQTSPHSFRIRLTVGMTSTLPLQALVEAFGVSIGHAKPNGPRRKPIFVWSVYCNKAAAILEELLPYLRLKHDQAVDAIALARRHKRRGGKRLPGHSHAWDNSWFKLGAEEVFERTSLVERMRARNV